MRTNQGHLNTISTHALTWSATTCSMIAPWAASISTHALTWSATVTSSAFRSGQLFQLTHSRGVRRAIKNKIWCPVRFQLTHSRGVRPPYFTPPYQLPEDFNSRTHVECDKSAGDDVEELENFNSRTHVECDTLALWLGLRMSISTHALTWSATGTCHHALKNRNISTHALTWSATIFRNRLQLQQQISTHALTWSATQLLMESTKHWIFQLTHSRGVRLPVPLPPYRFR